MSENMPDDSNLESSERTRLHRQPSDFALRLEYHSASVPPPDYYEYTISFDPDGVGEFHFIDEDQFKTDEFVAIITPDEETFKRIYGLITAVGLCSPAWQPPDRQGSDGGEIAWLEVVCGGNCSHTQISPNQNPDLWRVVQAIKAIVGTDVWAKVGIDYP